jgi:methionine-rich copper-binding protein CopC
MTWRRVTGTLCVALLALLSASSIVSAHAVMESSNPVADSTVRRVPRNISITLTEPPAPGTTVHVIDGCSGNVASQLGSDGHVLDVGIGEAEPGPWSVYFRTISTIDGHTRSGDFNFTVRGKASCGGGNGSEDKPFVRLGGEDAQIASDLPADGGGFPVIPFAIGSVVLVGIAVLLRYAMG